VRVEQARVGEVSDRPDLYVLDWELRKLDDDGRPAAATARRGDWVVR